MHGKRETKLTSSLQPLLKSPSPPPPPPPPPPPQDVMYVTRKDVTEIDKYTPVVSITEVNLLIIIQ